MSDAQNGPPDQPEQGSREPDGQNSSSFFRRRASRQAQPDAPPPPPRRSKRREGALSALSGFLSVLLLFAIAGVFGVIAVMHKLREPGPLGAEKIVYIAPRSDVPDILATLEREGVIDSPMLMNIALLIEGARSKLKPGEYLFKQNSSLREVMDELVGGRQLLHGVTVPEGLTTEQVLGRLRDNEVLAGDMPETPKEGALLPETYKVARGYPRAKLLIKMQEDQRKFLDHIWSRRSPDLPIKTPYELVTLASIVEKETGRADERPRVAAVFVNRLRKGMRLQSDPTIVYGLVGGKATLGRGILRSELEKYTPYNTYAIEGLPPGPIANPGKAALEAAANPSRTQDLYFVADGTGGHVFAETLEQHQRNVQRWRQIERDQKEKGVDRAEPGSFVGPSPQPDQAPPARRRRGEADGIGRLIAVDEPREDHPRGLRVTADHGALKRLGAYLPDVPPQFAGENAESLRLSFERAAAPKIAPPLFTTDFAERARPETANVALLLAAPQEEEADAVVADTGDDLSDPSATYPVPDRLRAEQRARAARLGLAPEPAADDAGGETAVAAGAQEAVAAAAGRRGRARAFDASEGTPLDPLRDKSWDLSSPKTVPNLASYR
ncbi:MULTISPECIES: endolytic transglycosylase MltG [Methylosinus]|uniref:Endolytic murein transglycosylase n=1 Tax=Methylosinus trichosporium (strain ATCC 35070 / NCIMB 11131 / UNIQEM 75 / OB3b) TaxID=595536 RepID=A0A2D2D659_METT3|nr:MULTISPECIES: endolytic transglycosylase MltG [Methylosinus]ATQ70466.1 aminodeoxychorismate lyase [Methylosinus trichosporium OB3b]